MLIKTIILFALLFGNFGLMAQNKNQRKKAKAATTTQIIPTSIKNVFDIARKGSIAEMKALIALNADTINKINENGHQPLLLACYRGNYEIAYFLMPLVKQIDFIAKDGTALTACVFLEEKDMAEKLLQLGANPNLTDDNGASCLIMAVQTKNKTITNLLLNYKADKSIKDKQGKTALDYAIFANNLDLINILK